MTLFWQGIDQSTELTFDIQYLTVSSYPPTFAEKNYSDSNSDHAAQK
jgi:hypothetical protein